MSKVPDIMRLINIEGWTISVADRLKRGEPIEDARVEVKSKWLDPIQAARRIAAHANSAGGEPILWIIGVDDANGTVVGADKQELSAWWPAVQSEFNDLSPSMTDLNVLYGGKTIVALLFDTDRAPFVVRNPKFGQPGSGSVSQEVPWREGTTTRSATRSDLLRLLLPLEDLPVVTILGMYLLANKHDQTTLRWRLEANIYIVLRRKGEIVIPFHMCSATADIGDSRRHVKFNQVFLQPYPRPGSGTPGEPGSHTVRYSPTEIIVATAGMAFFGGDGTTGQREFGEHIGDPAHVRINLFQAHDSKAIILQQTIKSFPGPTEAAR
jgi:hypothetical protein